MVTTLFNQWNDVLKKKIILNEMRRLCCVYSKIIYASECDVVNVDEETSISFINNNHLYGYLKTPISIGLLYRGELVGMLSIDIIDSDFFEIKRYCIKEDYCIYNALDKMLMYFNDNYHNVEVYIQCNCDMYSINNNLFKSVGFVEVCLVEPECKWLKNNKIALQSEIDNIISNYSGEEDIVEYLHEQRYFRLYNSGYIILRKEFN